MCFCETDLLKTNADESQLRPTDVHRKICFYLEAFRLLAGTRCDIQLITDQIKLLNEHLAPAVLLFSYCVLFV